MTEQSTTRRTRTLRAAFDVADSAATVTAGAAAGLTAYRALRARPAETRLTLALAAAGLAVAVTDQSAHRLLAPARRRLGIERYPAPVPAVSVPSPGQLAADARAHAAVQAAYGAHALDRSGGALTKTANWQGQPDGSATCELTHAAHLLYNPSGTDAGTAYYNGRPRYYELVADGEHPTVITTLTQLTDLLARHADGRPLDASDEDDPWTPAPDRDAVPATALGADDDQDEENEDGEDHDDDRDQGAEAWAEGRL